MDRLGGRRYATSCREDGTKMNTLSCRRVGWASITHIHMRYQAIVRTLRERRTSVGIEDTAPFRQSQVESTSGVLR